MPLVRTVPHTWQFHPPPYGPLRPVVGATPVRVLQTGELAGNAYCDLPLIPNYRFAPARARRPAIRPVARGMAGTGQQVLFAAPQIAGATLATASAMGAAWATAAIPVVGPVIAGVTVALMLIFGRKRPGQKIATTEVVDKIEPIMRDNLRGYVEGPRNQASQQQALANFDAAWQFVRENCCPSGLPDCKPMGPPGRWCIEDRQAGGKHDWFRRYRQPIAEDVPVGSDEPIRAGADFLASVFGGAPAVTGPGGRAGVAAYAPLLIGVALIGAALVVVK